MAVFINRVEFYWNRGDFRGINVGYAFSYIGSKSGQVTCNHFADYDWVPHNTAERMREAAAQEAGCPVGEVFFHEDCPIYFYDGGDTSYYSAIAGMLNINEFMKNKYGDNLIDKGTNIILNSIMADTFDRQKEYDQALSGKSSGSASGESYSGSGASYSGGKKSGGCLDTVSTVVGLLIMLLIAIWFLDKLGVFRFLKKVGLVAFTIMKWALIIAAVIGVIWLIVKIVQKIRGY